MRSETGNAKLRTEFDGGERSWRLLWESVLRPVAVLFGSSVLIALSLFGSVVFSYFYVMAVTLPDILESRYGLSPALTGSAFMSFSELSPPYFFFVGLFLLLCWLVLFCFFGVCL